MDDGAIERLERVMEAGFGVLADLQRETNARLDQHEKVLVKLVAAVESLNARFDNFLTGAHREEHEALKARVERIEAHLGLRTQ